MRSNTTSAWGVHPGGPRLPLRGRGALVVVGGRCHRRPEGVKGVWVMWWGVGVVVRWRGERG